MSNRARAQAHGHPALTGYAADLHEQMYLVALEVLQSFGLDLSSANLHGLLPASRLPGSTMLNRGDWSVSANYRMGDVVFDDGFVYVALANNVAITTDMIATWRPIGSTDTISIMFDDDGDVMTDEDGDIMTTG